jgi:hypothetical protein
MRRQNCFFVVAAFFLGIVLGGCAQVPISETLFFSYNQTTLGKTNSADELNYIAMSQMTLLSTSDTVVASWGQNESGVQQWLNVVAFDETTGFAIRKYFFFVDEKARSYPFVHPQWAARFDGQLTLDKAVLEKPYANKNVRSIAIIKEIQKQFSDDIRKVASDNKNIGLCQMVVNESFEQILLLFTDSPEWASKLDTPEGVTFDHRNYGKGTLYLHETNGIISIAIDTGSQPVPKGAVPNPYDPNTGAQ